MQKMYCKKSWKEQLKQMKLAHLQATAPGFFTQSGGFKMKVEPYKDNTANGLTRAIIDFVNFSGGYANRISVQGQARVEKIPLAGGNIMERVRYTSGTTNKGTADIHALFMGRHMSIEVKIGSDQMSEAQHKERQRIERAGGLYFVARNMPEFIAWFKGVNPSTSEN